MQTVKQQETLKLFLLVVGIVMLYQITANLAISIALGAALYIALMLRKLYEIHHWLTHGMSSDLTPESGGIMGSIITLIYRHKRTIEESNRQQMAITRQFNETIAAIPSATIVLNTSHDIEWANYPALSLLGINGQRDVGIRIDHLLRHESFTSQLYADNTEQFEMVSPVSPEITLAVQLVKYAHRKRLLIAHNITPHMEVQRSRKTFIANASHELRTPLTVIAGYLEFMQGTPDLPDSLKRPLEQSIEQSANMQVLINDLLALSKLEDNYLNPKKIAMVDLTKHLKTIIRTLNDSGKTKQHRIISHCDTGLAIEAAEKELNSVCYNLINNALKYSDKGSEITIGWHRISDSTVKFSVADKGIGIAPEHVAHLTERFYRVDSGRSRRVGGTGLGLSIVKHIIERHHGRLEVESRLGEGSTFSVILPVYPLGARQTQRD